MYGAKPEPHWRQEMSKYKKKSVVIEAEQLTWKNWSRVCDFLGDIINEDNPARNSNDNSSRCGEDGPPWIELNIPTLAGDHIAKHGDWIIKGIKGEFYPCKPDIFEAAYQPGSYYPGEGNTLQAANTKLVLRLGELEQKLEKAEQHAVLLARELRFKALAKERGGDGQG